MTTASGRLFDSFFAGGFECSSHRRHDGRRLDLLAATGHDRHARADYAAMRAHGLRTVRDGLRWHLIEPAAGRRDWSSFLPMLQAATDEGLQPVWDLCHYGWPDDVDIWRPAFVDRFAAFAGAVARLVREHSEAVPIYCAVNEISYWSWAGGDQARMNPMAQGRGLELKHQLVRAAIAAIEAVREADPRARFVQVDPVVQVAAQSPGDEEEAAALCRVQHDGWLMLSGDLWPGLGGDPSYLDLLGVNYYSDNQWFLHGGAIPPGHPAYRPFRDILADVALRHGRPVFIAETGAEGPQRAPWLRYVCGEVAAAREAGVDVQGLCLYPVLDYPGWVDERHCETGLLGLADSAGRRPVHHDLDRELAEQQARFGEPRAWPAMDRAP